MIKCWEIDDFENNLKSVSTEKFTYETLKF